MGVMVPCDKILAKAREIGADVIGLSRTDHAVARRDGPCRQGNGARRHETPPACRRRHHLGRPHRHQDRAPLLRPGRPCARRLALGAGDHLIVIRRSARDFVRDNEERHAALRAQHAQKDKAVVSLAVARERAFTAAGHDLRATGARLPRHAHPRQAPPVPPPACADAARWAWRPLAGRQPLPVALSELVTYIDWTPFFHTWELRGVWLRDEGRFKSSNPEVVEQAHKLHDDALAMLDRIVKENLFQARGIFGFFPANRRGRRHRGLDRRHPQSAARCLPHPAPADRQGKRQTELRARRTGVAPLDAPHPR